MIFRRKIVFKQPVRRPEPHKRGTPNGVAVVGDPVGQPTGYFRSGAATVRALMRVPKHEDVVRAICSDKWDGQRLVPSLFKGQNISRGLVTRILGALVLHDPPALV